MRDNLNIQLPGNVQTETGLDPQQQSENLLEMKNPDCDQSSFIPKQTQRCSFLFFVFFQQPPAVNLLHHNYTLVCTKVNHVYDQIGVSPFERAANGDDCVSSAQVQQRPVHQRSGRGGGGRRNEGVTTFTSLHCLLFSPCENFFVLFLFAFFKFFFFLLYRRPILNCDIVIQTQ